MNRRGFIVVAVIVLLLQLIVFVVFYNTTKSMEDYCTNSEVRAIIDSTLIEVFD